MAALRIGRERQFLTFLCLALVIAALAIVFGAELLGKWDCGTSCNVPADKIKAIGDARSAIVQFVLAIGAGGTLYFTWRNYTRAVDDRNEARLRAIESQKLAVESQGLTREARASDNLIRSYCEAC